MAISWKIVLPMIGMALALTAGRMVADWSTPDETPEPLAAGFTAFSDERYSRAEALFEAARLRDPDNGDVYHGLALVALARHGDRARAEALFAAGRLAEACRVARSVRDAPDAEEPLIDRIRDTPDCVTR